MHNPTHKMPLAHDVRTVVATRRQVLRQQSVVQGQVLGRPVSEWRVDAVMNDVATAQERAPGRTADGLRAVACQVHPSLS